MTKKELLEIIDEEISNVKLGKINEELTESELDKIRKMIRKKYRQSFLIYLKNVKGGEHNE